jgi:hypothetical protein
MTESWGVALVVLAAVLVGVVVPVLVQLRATLRAMEKTLVSAGPRLDEALGATLAAAARIDAFVVRVEGADRIEEVIDGVASATRIVQQLKETVRVASAVGAVVGPALAAAVQAFREDREVAAPTSLQAVEGGPGRPATEPERQAS